MGTSIIMSLIITLMCFSALSARLECLLDLWGGLDLGLLRLPNRASCGGGAWTLGLSESPTDPLRGGGGGPWTFEKVDSCKMGGSGYKVTFV